MKKFTTLSLVLGILTLGLSLVGCDNRSQLEKDADKAVSSIEKVAQDVQQ